MRPVGDTAGSVIGSDRPDEAQTSLPFLTADWLAGRGCLAAS